MTELLISFLRSVCLLLRRSQVSLQTPFVTSFLRRRAAMPRCHPAEGSPRAPVEAGTRHPLQPHARATEWNRPDISQEWALPHASPRNMDISRRTASPTLGLSERVLHHRYPLLFHRCRSTTIRSSVPSFATATMSPCPLIPSAWITSQLSDGSMNVFRSYITPSTATNP